MTIERRFLPNGKPMLERSFYPTRGYLGSRIGPGVERDRLLDMVNAIAPEPQTAETVRIRKGVICNNRVDHYSTRFTDRALQQIVDLWPGVNNHVLHDSFSAASGMPVGIGLEASIRAIEGVDGGLEVFGAWYNSIGEPANDYIDAMVSKGIWRELSLAWWMNAYTCDVDGKPIGYGEDCSDFYPGQELSDGRVVVGIMDDVVDLVEFSYVPRGGQIGTSIERDRPERVENLIMAARGRAEKAVARQHEDPMKSWGVWVSR